MSQIMQVTAAQCPHCFDVIFSRTRHDMRSCSCGKTHIDGGREYVKLGFNKKPPVTFPLKVVGLSPEVLYSDWSYKIDDFGKVRQQDKVNQRKYRYVFNRASKLNRYPKISK